METETTRMTKYDLIKIADINKYQGGIPAGYELVIYEDGEVVNSSAVLYGFDEVGLFDHDYQNPKYGFLKLD